MRRLPPLVDLTLPAAESRTLREVLSLALGRLLADCWKLPRDYPRHPADRRELSASLEAASELANSRAGAPVLFSALASPTLGVLVRCARNELLRSGGARPRVEAVLRELAVTLAFELWLRGGLARDLEFTRLPARVLSLSAERALLLPESARSLSFSGRSARIVANERSLELSPEALEAGPDELGFLEAPFHALAGRYRLGTLDNNPRAEFGAEPGEPGNPLDLGGRSAGEWCARLTEALELIRDVLPELWREMELCLRVLFPVGYLDETHRSASYRESIGAIYMTLHPNVMTLAEAIIHEFSHNKLHAVFELDPVIDNDNARAYRSPLRPDPRPLRGVLLAVHAFLPVAVLYQRMLERDHPLSRSHYFPERFAHIKSINRDGAAVVLEHAQPSAAGKPLFAEIQRWIEHFA